MAVPSSSDLQQKCAWLVPVELHLALRLCALCLKAAVVVDLTSKGCRRITRMAQPWQDS